MKRFVTLMMALFIFVAIQVQNLQLHYDFGKDRGYLTSTLEMFRPDKLGSTFFFVDMNYDVNGQKGVNLAYWEIAREFNISKTPLAAHIEYNGGLFSYKVSDNTYGVPFHDAGLLGIDYIYNNSDFSRGFTLQLLYKYIRDVHDVSFQITGVWYMHMLNNKLTFSGFADFWKEKTLEGNYIFLTEPQLWYNFNKTLSVGSEVEMSVNFAGHKGFKVCPTAAVKWNF